ncbi:MAG: peptidase [Cyanosarcina radialis HA8281-LM2]|jgi:uncharacterized iron-regulated membrane protein|nr:peptidase [Cyanosarcina radialis HA8281-LM2]
MIRNFRKYHRLLALIVFLPLFLTGLTGMGYVILDEWLNIDNVGNLLMSVHTGRFLKLDKIYPVLNGLGLLVMLGTGISMTGLFRPRRQS